MTRCWSRRSRTGPAGCAGSPRSAPAPICWPRRDCSMAGGSRPTGGRPTIFTCDGGIWTSAGVTAGIDLSLALIQDDLGHDQAMRIARHLVVFLKRPGDQAQFSATLEAQIAVDQDFAGLHAWIREHLAEELKVERLAEQAGMSARTFARAYAAKAGLTPARMVEAIRIEAERRALEASERPLKLIARDCGFGDEERMRRAFQRRLGVCPLDYRTRFAAA